MAVTELMMARDVPFELFDIDLFSATDDELRELSDTMGLSLSLEEMLRIRDHFEERGRNPTDVEMESIAQAWSEHCCYKSSKTCTRTNNTFRKLA